MLDEVAEEGPFEALPVMRRRRPSGVAAPIRAPLGTPGWAWVVVLVLVAALWAAAIARGRLPGGLLAIDREVGDAVARVRTWAPLGALRAAALLGSVGVVMLLRWVTIAVLALTARWRELVTFVGAVLLTRLAMVALVAAIGRPRPDGTIMYGWEGYSHPSLPVAMLSVGVAGAVWALVPAGRGRRVAVGAGVGIVTLLAVARVALGVDHPSDAVLGAVAGWAVASLAFRVLAPDDVFPVTYRRRRGAHHEIDARRRDAIREALDEQAGLELLDVEPFGEEHSGGSTPLRLRVRRVDGRREETLFGKLYSATHLRGDRWYKLGRTILYGALEDEASFNSVRQLVEHEDYMLRLMREAGVSAVEPRGVVELEPEREYLILMTFLRRAEEADEDADVDDAVIDAGLRNVRAMWDHGLAHRDLKPGNVLIHDGAVSLIDVAFGEVRPSPWRQAVDLANMMLLLALASEPDRVYRRAAELFAEDDLAEAFAAAVGPTIPRELRAKLAEDERDVLGRFRELAPDRDQITVQRWTLRRIAITVRTAAIVAALGALLAVNLANPRAP
jgi:membrane-associated phospholipid phosphatase/tRNA A-37 threonylcarbamoyl transferase component Bud32